jgi:carboxyl-terminal processing protease
VLAGDRTDRLVATARSVAGDAIAPIRLIRKACGQDPLCAARFLARGLGPRARLEKIRHPDTDTIRRVRTRPSVTGWSLRPSGTLRLSLDHFGRKAKVEINTALRQGQAKKRSPVNVLEIDLRRNRGGNLNRMLKVAALFTGPVPGAVHLNGSARTTSIGIPDAGQRLRFRRIDLLVGPDTASSAEVFAGLLRTLCGARLLGRRTHGKDYLLRAVPVSHDWRLLVPAGVITLPGVSLAGGLVPDVPLASER